MLSHQTRPSSGVIMGSSKENVVRSNVNVAGTSRPSSSTYAPPSSTQNSTSSTAEPQYIEHVKRDSRGHHVTKRYIKGFLLGKGGFAKCYRFTDADTNEEWACKVVQKASLTKQRHKAKLQTEIKIHKGLSHKHVVRFEEVFEDKENVYIIMELCQNQTMLELVKRKKRLTEAETRRFMLQMLEGVKYMHTNKIIHRDLKLGNLFLGRHDEIKVGDFGLACKLNFDGERKRTLCGTPNYIAPEVLEGKNGHSYEVDTWSIGVVLYTCLVGKPPFETSDVKSTYKLIKSNTYSFPERLHISDAAKSLIRRILRSDPEQRPGTDEILMDDFFQGEGLALIGAVPQAPVPTKIVSSSSTTVHSSATDSYRVPLKQISKDHVDTASNKKYGFADWSRPSSAALDRDNISSSTNIHERNITTTTASTENTAISNRISAHTSTASSNLLSRPSSSSDLGKVQSYDKHSSNWPSDKADEKTGSAKASEELTPINQLAKAIGALEIRKTSSDGGGTWTRTASSGSAGGIDIRPKEGADKEKDSKDGDNEAAKAGVPNDGEDQQALYIMHQNIKQYSSSTTSASSAKTDPATLPLPSLWVSRWVDYSKKYGLGYKLSNGCSGVFFNDATKMLLETDGDSLAYIERMRRDDSSKYDVREEHRLSSYPTELTKKVTLMEHFKNYLDDTHPNRGSPVHVPTSKTESSEVSGVYVRKWMRTRHSIIFRLSNNNFQVNFFDDTEVLLWADKKWVTYKGKNKIRATHQLSDISTIPELAKRIKYVKDILSQLVTRS